MEILVDVLVTVVANVMAYTFVSGLTVTAEADKHRMTPQRAATLWRVVFVANVSS